jgi:hypothetical protein
MRVTRATIIGGLLGVVLGAIGLGACSHLADDCHNTKTCIPPSCEAGDDGGLVCAPCVDGGVRDPGDAGDCCETEDGGLVCVP